MRWKARSAVIASRDVLANSTTRPGFLRASHTPGSRTRERCTVPCVVCMTGISRDGAFAGMNAPAASVSVPHLRRLFSDAVFLFSDAVFKVRELRHIMRKAHALLVLTIAGAFGLSPPVAANSISSVENARAKERAGYYLNDEDVGNLRRYGAQSDRGGGFGYGYDDDDDYLDDGPGVGVYIGTDGPYGDPYDDDGD